MSEDPTVREYLSKWLEDKGLWDHEAVAVLDSVEKDALTEIYGNRIGEYPQTVRAMSVMVAEAAAVDWLKENAPKHFALRAFKALPPPSPDTPQTAGDPA